MLKDIKKLMELRKEAKNIQAKLKKIHIEASDDQNVVKITMDAEQKVLKVEILEEVAKDKLEKASVEAMNKAIKKSQEIAAENMKGILGDLSAGM
ncbi:YbaB/EbfC family nucleoid-associated protein [bacterium]|nr:YbaB/EbfC family nucleoid-associated protein [bacterium]MBT6293539.1 YbaB/EbfC family nucleoid-associated protein [bacterium]